jgi:hypothetical protein
VARLNVFVVSERGLPEATALAHTLVARMDRAVAQGPPEKGVSPGATPHALADIRAAIVGAGGVSAAVAMIRLPEEMGSFADVARRGGKQAAVASSAAAAATALLARLCVGCKSSLTELRIDDGLEGLVRMLCHDTLRSPRAVADACAVVLAAVTDSVRATRAAMKAGIVGVLHEILGDLADDLYHGPGLARLGSDRDFSDQLSAVLTAFAELKSRERERDRVAEKKNNSDEATKKLFLDISRLLPPVCALTDAHLPAAAAAFAAVLRSARGAAARMAAAAAESTLRRTGTVSALANLPLGTTGHRAAVIIEAALGAESIARLRHGGPGRAPLATPRTPLPPVAGAAAGPAAALTIPTADDPPLPPALTFSAVDADAVQRSQRSGGGVAAFLARAVEDVAGLVGNAVETVGDFLEETEELVQEFMEGAGNELKTMLAVQTISIADIKARRRQYITKLKWASVFNQNLGWVLAAFTWTFGSWVIITYGVLIYRAMGPGEESVYISNWGMAFVVNTFGLESLQIIGRKAFFMVVVTRFKKSFMRAQEALGWYEVRRFVVGALFRIQGAGFRV